MLLPTLMFNGDSNLIINGGTNVSFSPLAFTVNSVLRPILEKMNIKFDYIV